MQDQPRRDMRAAFGEASAAFADVVNQIGHQAWDRPGLGVWTVRDLVGHTSRSLVTLESYLGQPATAAEMLDGPVAYFVAVRAALANAEAVAQRGRDAGASLGDDPAAYIESLRHRVVGLVEGADDAELVVTPFGTMTLGGYLPTRVFELAVHTLDIARALDLTAPPALGPAIGLSCELAGQLAAQLSGAPAVLMALTGRTGLPDGFSVV